MDPIILALMTIVVNIVVLSIGGTWKISELKASLIQAIADSRQVMSIVQDKHEHDVSETIHAMREKIREVELFNRDTFLRREEFYKAMASNTDAIKSLGEKIDHRLDRMEAKIDLKEMAALKGISK